MGWRDPFLERLDAHERVTDGGGHADHEARLRRLELRYYAILAGLATGLIGALAVALRAPA